MPVNDELGAYFAARDRRRAERVRNALDTLTPREALLVREAAVMGFVLGMQDARAGNTTVPADTAIVHEVVLGCVSSNDSNPNHFRLIAAADEGRRPRVTRKEH